MKLIILDCGICGSRNMFYIKLLYKFWRCWWHCRLRRNMNVAILYKRVDICDVGPICFIILKSITKLHRSWLFCLVTVLNAENLLIVIIPSVVGAAVLIGYHPWPARSRSTARLLVMRTSVATIYSVMLFGCSETSASLVLNTCIPVWRFREQFSSCAVNKS